MPKQHYLPAAFIGGFSHDRDHARRTRRVWVGRRNSAPFVARAANIGWARDLYTLALESDSQAIDDVWTAYERRLPSGIDELIQTNAPLSASTWLRILVPFVAAIFVRGKDFGPRFEARGMSSVRQHLPADNTNQARTIELQRLLAPVCAARWVVLHHDGLQPLVCNELGLSKTVDAVMKDVGWVIPLSQIAVLGIFPTVRRGVVTWADRQWTAPIEHRELPPAEVDALNRAIVNAAQEFVFGPTKASIVALQEALAVPTPMSAETIMEGWPFIHRARVEHEFDWHRLVSVIAQEPGNGVDVDIQSIDWPALAADWHSQIVLPINLPEFPSGLQFDGSGITLDLIERPWAWPI